MAIRSNFSRCCFVYICIWVPDNSFSLIDIFADKDREGKPHRACNGIPPHYLSVHGSRSRDDDLTTLLICFYLSRFCGVLRVFNKDN